MTAETVGFPRKTPKSILTLSAAYEVLLPDDRSAAARFDDLLTLADTARTRGYGDLAETYLERIVAEIVSCPDGLNGPGGHAA